MIAPGAPTDLAHEIAANECDSKAMARGVVRDVMDTRYDPGLGRGYAGAAAFDVLDLDPAKIARAETAIKRLNDDAAVRAEHDSQLRDALRSDARSVDGMVRMPGATKDMPWHADRPAIAFYSTLAGDARLDARLRADAHAAAGAVADLVLAHGESRAFAPFGGSNYRDAAGPTVHLPTTRAQIDPWAQGGVTETHNAFYEKTDGGAMTRVLA